MKLKRLRVLLSLGCVLTGTLANTPAWATNYSNLETVCIDLYGYQVLNRCLNYIQSQFNASQNCSGAVVSGTETAETLAGQVSGCTVSEACYKVSVGAGEGGSGSGCGGGGGG